jgi:transposase
MIGPDSIQVYVVMGTVDMRKSIDGLSLLVSEQLALDAFAGHMFAFTNRKRNVVKLLYWQRNGFCLWMKRLEKDKFRWPESREEVLNIGPRELRWLLEGLDIHQKQAHGALHYSTLC